MIKRDIRNIDKVIIHCSASDFGDAKTIDQWHKDRGWDGIGYHYVILNGFRKSNGNYIKKNDGLVERGRPISDIGAHAHGYNDTSIGICLIGNRHFTWNQFVNLKSLLDALLVSYDLYTTDIYAHYNFNNHKTCPNFDVNSFIGVFYNVESY